MVGNKISVGFATFSCDCVYVEMLSIVFQGGPLLVVANLGLSVSVIDQL